MKAWNIIDKLHVVVVTNLFDKLNGIATNDIIHRANFDVFANFARENKPPFQIHYFICSILSLSSITRWIDSLDIWDFHVMVLAPKMDMGKFVLPLMDTNARLCFGGISFC